MNLLAMYAARRCTAGGLSAATRAASKPASLARPPPASFHHTTKNADSMPGHKALVVIAPGSEEMETVITVDVLRRGGVCLHPVRQPAGRACRGLRRLCGS